MISASARRFALLAGLFALAVVSFSAIPSSAEEYSHVRIVRLSFVEGTVTVQRPDMDDWATAPANTPIEEGFKLSTGADSFAEVEFENANSTARFGEQSVVEFTQLALAPDGGKVNRLVLDQGYATFHFDPADSDVYEVKAGDTTVTPYGKTEFRLDLENGQMRIEVFKGSVEAAGPGGSTTLAKNSVVEIRPGEAAQVAEGITKDAWDQWVSDRDQLEATTQAPAGSGSYSAEVSSSFYGWSDLGNYGDWGYLAGYGNVWFPGVGYGWSPYSLGRWCWYPGFGFTWISGEPWGWLPFHYGGWFLDPALGWFWTPYGFGAWSPALVTWYQGPGWVGWVPRPATPPARGGLPVGGRGVSPRSPMPGSCLAGRTCMTVMSAKALQNGQAVTAQDVKAVDLEAARGRLVPSPEVTPTRLASLTGVPVAQAAALLGRSAGGRTGVAASSPVSAREGFSAKAPASVVPESERASTGFFGQRGGPSSERSAHAAWGGHSSHFDGSSHEAPKASASGGGRRGGGFSDGGGHASSTASSGGGHSSGGGGFSGGGGGGGHSGGGGGGGHSGGGGGGGSHH